MMNWLPILKAFGVATVLVFLTDWYFFGVLFHQNYHAFPGVWRKYKDKKDEMRSIGIGMVISLLSCLAFIGICDFLGLHSFSQAMVLGSAMWLIGPVSLLISYSIVMNLHRSIVCSHSLGWLARFGASAIGIGLFL